MATHTLVAWCPDWPVLASGGDIAGPVAALGGGRVVAVSAAARAEGVVPGLRRREAQARCPDLRVFDADPAHEARAWEPVVAAVTALTPVVEILEPGAVAFRTRGPSRYFGGDGPLAARVVEAVDDAVGAERCAVGVADGRFAATLAASERARQDGPIRVVVVPPGESRAWLAFQSIGVIGQPELAELFRRLGVTTLGALAALPAPSVLGRFGADGAAAHRLARGFDHAALAARSLPPDLTVSAEMDPPAERVDTAAFAAKSLADELHEQLTARGLVCHQVVIEAQTEHGERLVRRWRHQGALTSTAIADRVRWQLDGWLTRAGGGTSGGLILLRLIPEDVGPDRGRQLRFWGGFAAADERAARGLARVQALLGPDAVATAVLGGGRGLAEQVRLVPWGDPRHPSRPGPPAVIAEPVAQGGALTGQPRRAKKDAALETPPWPGRVVGPAPAVVHQPCEPAELRDSTGQTVTVSGRGVVSAPPDSSITGRPWERVVSWAGPWPVEERWWDSAGRRVARFQLALESGVAHIVVREAGRWWLEATYD